MAVLILLLPHLSSGTRSFLSMVSEFIYAILVQSPAPEYLHDIYENSLPALNIKGPQ